MIPSPAAYNIKAVPASMEMNLERLELRKPFSRGHGGHWVVQTNHVVEPAVGNEDGLTRLKNLGDNRRV